MKNQEISDVEELSLQHLSTFDVSDRDDIQNTPRNNFQTARFCDTIDFSDLENMVRFIEETDDFKL